MTLYVTLSAIRDHRITFDTLFTVSRNASAQAPTKMGFPVGTQVTVDNAIKMMMVKSANDMAVLLAEGVDGTIDNFAQEMTDTAHRLGMTETNYVNPNGLPADGQITSARDLAILARALIREFPQYSFYWHIPAIQFGRRVVRNYNPLLGRYPGTDGMKTGFICASGFNLVATATRDNKQLIAVVLGAPSGAARAVKAAEMLESGFKQNPLSWLLPSLGTVDQLKPIDAAPPNLKDEMCGPHRKRMQQADGRGRRGRRRRCGPTRQRRRRRQRCRPAILSPAVGAARTQCEERKFAIRRRPRRADRRLYRADAPSRLEAGSQACAQAGCRRRRRQDARAQIEAAIARAGGSKPKPAQ